MLRFGLCVVRARVVPDTGRDGASMTATSKALSARARARAARIRMQADRAGRDRRIEDRVAAALKALGAIEDAKAAGQSGEKALAAAVALLADDGVGVGDISSMIEVPETRVRALVRDGNAAKEASDTDVKGGWDADAGAANDVADGGGPAADGGKDGAAARQVPAAATPVAGGAAVSPGLAAAGVQ